MESPYVVGHSLQLSLLSNDVIQVKIQKAYEPFSMAVVLQVSFESSPPSEFSISKGEVTILKLYDRRFATDLREFHEAEPYGLEIQDQYAEDLLTKPPGENNNDGGHSADDEDEESEVEKLRDIQKRCLEQAAAEEQVYTRLEALQRAHKVPKYYSAVNLVVDDFAATLDRHPGVSSSVKDYLRIPGCLISFVDGFLLDDLQLHMPKEKWIPTVAIATAAINEIGDYSVINDDVRPTNIFIVEENGEHKAVVFDFAQARLRRKDESDEEWREHKWMADEEGAIGYVMYVKLGLGEFEKTEQGSLRYRVRAEDMSFYAA